MMSALLVAMSLERCGLEKAAGYTRPSVYAHQIEPQAGWPFIWTALPSALSRM